MDLDFIDLIYQDDAVEGVAVFDSNNKLLENQLSLSPRKVEVIGRALYRVKKGLKNAGREMSGFLIRSDSVTLLVGAFSQYLVVLEISEGASINTIDKHLRSILKDKVKPVKQTPPTTPEPVQPVPVTHARSSIAQPQPVSEPQPILPPKSVQSVPVPIQPIPYNQTDSIDIDFVNFKDKLSKLMKTVAPQQVVKQMIDSSMKQMEIDTAVEVLSREVAVDLGYLIISKIPNQARREMVKKEYSMMLSES